MAKDPFRPRQVPDPTKAEFEARGDSTKLMKWTAQRFPFVYAQSMAGGDPGGCSERYNEFGNDPEITKALSLFGNNISKAVYETGTNIPLPYLEELEVKALGSLGTTRKAVLKVKCYSDEHLIELQKCWFIPGMDVRVQWGWSESCSGIKFNNADLVKDYNLRNAAATCKINNKRKTLPNYDGFQGIVTQFSYKLDKNNMWDCSIEVISAADPFTGTSVANNNCSCPGSTSTDQGEKKKDFGPMYEVLKDAYETGVGTWYDTILPELRKAFGGDRDYWCLANWNYFGVERTETGGEKEGSWYDDIFDGEETVETWISFGAFVDLLNAMSVPHEISGDKRWPFGRIALDDVYLPYPPGELVPGDPLAIYIEGSDADPKYIYEGKRYSHGNAYAYVTGDAIGKPSELGYIQLNKIMCNVIWLNQKYKQNYDGNGTLKGLLDSLLDEINRICGSPWEFITISTGEDCEPGQADPDGPTITILDGRAAQAADTPYSIPSKVGNSSLRDFGLSMKLTGAMKTQALYANNHQKASGDNGAGCLGTATAPFYLPSGAQVKNKAKPEPGTAKTSCGTCKDDGGNCGGESIWTLMNDMKYGEINGQTIGSLTEYSRKYVQCKRCTDCSTTKGCAGVALPFDFSFTVDGVGGFEFGQVVTSDRIPKSVRDAFRWQITKVEHKIKKGDWETTVSTVCRANPKGDDKNYPTASS